MLTQWPKKGSVGQVATIEINEFTNRIHVQLIKTYSYTDSNIKQKKVQVGKDQEKAQSEKDSHAKNRGGKKPN